MRTFPNKCYLRGSNLQYFITSSFNNEEYNKSGVGEMGENKLRQKIEINLFTEIAPC